MFTKEFARALEFHVGCYAGEIARIAPLIQKAHDTDDIDLAREACKQNIAARSSMVLKLREVAYNNSDLEAMHMLLELSRASVNTEPWLIMEIRIINDYVGEKVC